MKSNAMKKKRGRPLKMTPQEVLEKVDEYESITKQELAELFKCCQSTISKRIRTLRRDNEKIFYDRQGLFIIDKVESEKDVERIIDVIRKYDKK